MKLEVIPLCRCEEDTRQEQQEREDVFSTEMIDLDNPRITSLSNQITKNPSIANISRVLSPTPPLRLICVRKMRRYAENNYPDISFHR